MFKKRINQGLAGQGLKLGLVLHTSLLLTVLPAKSNSDFMFCLQSYQGLIIDISLVY